MKWLMLALALVAGPVHAQKTEKADVAGARHAIEVLGGSLETVVPAPSTARTSGTVVVVHKMSPTPAAYPRRPGTPSRKPLHN